MIFILCSSRNNKFVRQRLWFTKLNPAPPLQLWQWHNVNLQYRSFLNFDHIFKIEGFQPVPCHWVINVDGVFARDYQLVTSNYEIFNFNLKSLIRMNEIDLGTCNEALAWIVLLREVEIAGLGVVADSINLIFIFFLHELLLWFWLPEEGCWSALCQFVIIQLWFPFLEVAK